MKPSYQTQPAQLQNDPTPVISYQDATGQTHILSSKYSPAAEASRILAKEFQNTHQPTMVVLLGAGNIALIEQALIQYSAIPVIVICQDSELLNLTLHHLPTALIQSRKTANPSLFYTFSDLAEKSHSPEPQPTSPKSQSEPSHSESSHSEPSHSEPSHSESSHSEPSQSEPSQSESSQSEPSHSKSTHSKPSSEPISRSRPIIHSQFRQALAEIFREHSTKHIRFHTNPKEISRAQPFYQDIQLAITVEQEEKSINRATFSRFEKLWLRNLIKNTPAIIDAVPLAELIPVIKDYPVVIAGAAPSLEDELPLLKRYQDNLLIVVVDTAYAVMLKHGIPCDLVVSIDPQKINAKYLEAVSAKHTQETALIAEPSISHHGIKKFPHVFMFDNFSPYYAYLTGFFTPKGTLKVGGSVATVAFEMIKHSQPAALALSGIDLAYSREAYHLSGAFHEEAWFSSIHRFDTFQTRLFSIMNSKDVVPVLNRSNQTVYTDAAMELYKRWFEENSQDIAFPLFHTSKRACPITGIPYLSLGDFIQNYAKTSISKPILRDRIHQICRSHQSTLGSSGKDYSERKALFNQATQTLIARLQTYHNAGKTASKIVQSLLNLPTKSHSPKLLKKLDTLNATLQKPSIEKEFTATVMQQTLYDISDTTFTPPATTQNLSSQSNHPHSPPNTPQNTPPNMTATTTTKTMRPHSPETTTEKLRLQKALLLYTEVMRASRLNIRYLKTLL